MQTEAGGLRPELGSRGWASAGDTGPRGAGARGSHSAWQGLPVIETPNMEAVWLQEWRCCPGEGEGRWACWRGGPQGQQGHPRPQGLRPEPRVGARGRGEGRVRVVGLRSSPDACRSTCRGGPPGSWVYEMVAPERSRQVPVSLTPPLRPAPRPRPRPLTLRTHTLGQDLQTPCAPGLPIAPASGPASPSRMPPVPWVGWTVRASLQTMIYLRIKCITPRTCQFCPANVHRKSG